MNEDDKNGKLLNHEYDGIQELDNNLPTWWLWTFFLTIIFGFLYWLHYGLTNSGPNLDQELAQGMSYIEQLRKKSDIKVLGTEEIDETVLLVEGEKIYKSYCSACHKADGGGSVGPNLTDKFWIHGQGDETSIDTVIKEGILEKGMPAWKEVLKPLDMKAVLLFVLSLKNKNVSEGKAPQGNVVD